MRSTAVAHGSAGLTAVLLLVSLVVRLEHGLDIDTFVVLGSAYVLVQAGVGAVVAARRPANPIGWILLLASILWASSGALGDIALAAPDGAAWRSYAAWVAQVAFMPGIVILPWLLPLVFPDGRLPSQRWRPLLWVGLTSGLLAMFGAATAGELPDYPGIPAPFRLAGPAATAMEVANPMGWLGVTLVTLASIVPIVVRYRRSGAVVRQQLRWLLYSFALVALTMTLAAVLFSYAPLVSNALVLLGIATLPLAIGVAILRHRLFDIDRLISRTVSYSVVTALLLGSYAAGVLALGAAARALGTSSDVAVAVSTLVVAALFQPVRRLVQARVDRRFDRQRYDAARILEEFAAQLRREVRLDSLAEELRGVLAATVSPSQTSVWLVDGREP